MNSPAPKDLQERLHALPGVTQLSHHNGAWWASGPALDVAAMADLMHAMGIRMGTITAVPLGPQGETRVLYHWLATAQFVNFETVTREGALPSLANSVRAAAWAEREIHDLFGVTFVGHPNPAPLLKPDGLETGLLRQALCGPAVLARSPTLGL